jgi:hypothetical protein
VQIEGKRGGVDITEVGIVMMEAVTHMIVCMTNKSNRTEQTDESDLEDE